MSKANIARKIKGLVFILAGLWAIWASLSLIFTPTTVHIQEAIINDPVDGSQSIVNEMREISWYEAQGIWGVIVVVTFAFMYTLISLFALMDNRTGLAIFSILAGALTFLAALSIGGLYAPSLGGVILGWILLGVEQFLNNREQPQQ